MSSITEVSSYTLASSKKKNDGSKKNLTSILKKSNSINTNHKVKREVKIDNSVIEHKYKLDRSKKPKSGIDLSMLNEPASMDTFVNNLSQTKNAIEKVIENINNQHESQRTKRNRMRIVKKHLKTWELFIETFKNE